MKQIVPKEKLKGDWPYQSRGKQFHYKIEIYRQNNPIRSKSNYSYQTEFWIPYISDSKLPIHALQCPIEDLNSGHMIVGI